MLDEILDRKDIIHYTMEGESVSVWITVGHRQLFVRGSPFKKHPHVYRMSHDAFTFDDLYRLKNKESRLWKILDWFRESLPGWFLPRDFVMKLPASSESKSSIEAHAYEKMKMLQGRGIPRFYGVCNYSNSPAILLQYVDGYLFGDFSGKGRHDILRYDEEIMTCEKLIEDYHQRWVLEGAKPPTNSVELKNLENSLNEKRRAREEFYKKNSEENNVFITGMKKLASALTSAGITGDFNGSNIICDKESLAQPGMVHIIDFAEQEEGQTNESIMKDNNTSINSLLFEYGLINSRGS